MSEKNLVLELNAKMLFANQSAGLLNFNISKTIGGIKLIFWVQVHVYYSYKTDHISLGGCCQACLKKLLKLIYLKNCWSSKVDFWTSAFRRKGSYDQLVSNTFSSKRLIGFSEISHEVGVTKGKN